MKTIAIVPGTAGSRIVDRPEPSVTPQDEAKVRVLCVGICSPDRTEVSGGRARMLLMANGCPSSQQATSVASVLVRHAIASLKMSMAGCLGLISMS